MANIPPFKRSDPIPNVQTKAGINILVRRGHNTALKILMKNINRITRLKLSMVKSNPKLIRYNPIKFAMNSIRYLFNESPGVFLSSSMSRILVTSPDFFLKNEYLIKLCLN